MRKQSFLSLNMSHGLRPVKRAHWMARYAKAAVENAQGIESLHHSVFGGHFHSGVGHPLLNDDNFPLPAGWRKR